MHVRGGDARGGTKNPRTVDKVCMRAHAGDAGAHIFVWERSLRSIESSLSTLPRSALISMMIDVRTDGLLRQRLKLWSFARASVARNFAASCHTWRRGREGGASVLGTRAPREAVSTAFDNDGRGRGRRGLGRGHERGRGLLAAWDFLGAGAHRRW